MGIRVYVMVPKDRLRDLSTWRVGELLSYDGTSWYSLPSNLDSHDVVTEKEVLLEILSAISFLEECLKEGVLDEEEECNTRFRIQELVRLANLYNLLRNTGAILIKDSDTDVICRKYREGYVPIVSVLNTEVAREEMDWIEGECGGSN